MSAWVNEELKTADFNDKRLSDRLIKTVTRFYESPDKSIKAAGIGWHESKAAYRFFSNINVTLDKILQPHRDASLMRAREQPTVLIVQDTTEYDFTSKKELDGTGPLSTKSRQGFFGHNQLLFTPERLPLGVWGTNIKAREEKDDDEEVEDGKTEDEKAKNKKVRDENAKERKKKSIEDKESFRWLEGYRDASELQALAPETLVISVGDREYDIYEIFEERKMRLSRDEAAAHLLIRSKGNRLLKQDDQELIRVGEGTALPRKLQERIALESPLGEIEIAVKRKEQYKKNKAGSRIKTIRSARNAVLEIRTGQVTLAPPHRPDRKLSPMEINVVMVTEKNPPPNEDPIKWVLLTTLEVNGFDNAKWIIDCYAARWEIEVFHRVLKTGCKVEDLQLKNADRIQCAIGMYMIVAWRVMYVMKLGRTCPDLPCDLIFDKDEWQPLWQIRFGEDALQEAPSLNAFVTEVAKLGGFLARRRDGPPGPQAIWMGLNRVRDYAIAWQVFVKNQPPLMRRRE